MKRIAIVLAALALAAPALAAETAAGSGQDPMAGWKPRKVTNEAKTRKEILAALRQNEQAWKKGDVEAAAAFVDFPVLMVTDDSKGQAHGATWTREQWIEVMKPMFEHPMDMQVKHSPTVFVITDSLATVGDVATFTMKGRPVTVRNSMLMIRTEGKWRVKSMTEGGWGDMMSAQGAGGSSSPGQAGAPQEPPAPPPAPQQK
jgi:hypothetical protein